tara:strand:+ start:1213 stop:1401 length:189 start_codon:yes stop_codon:yes gene_type:complete
MAKDEEQLFVEYVDSSHANKIDTRRSSAGHIAMFGGGPVMFRGTKALSEKVEKFDIGSTRVF